MVLSPESFATDVTGVGSLVGVGALVYEEVVTLGEVSVAILADELLLGSRRPARPAEQARVVGGVERGGGLLLGGGQHVPHQQRVRQVRQHRLQVKVSPTFRGNSKHAFKVSVLFAHQQGSLSRFQVEISCFNFCLVIYCLDIFFNGKVLDRHFKQGE